jgi:predicted nucleotidyltransferase
MSSSSIGDALFTKTQQRVLGLLYGTPDKSLYTNEIVRRAGMGRGTVVRELGKLVAAGLLAIRREGNQLHYRANPECPIYHELSAIVKKTFGVAGVIREALAPLAGEIAWVFIFGSVASGKESSGSDIDLMVVGGVSYSEVVTALYSVQQELGREINPKIFSKGEWTERCETGDAFIKEVLAKPRMDVMGGGNEYGKPGGDLAGEA